jgi:hypothetical protein
MDRNSLEFIKEDWKYGYERFKDLGQHHTYRLISYALTEHYGYVNVSKFKTSSLGEVWYLNDGTISEKFRGKGYGKYFLQYLNTEIQNNNAVGLLYDAISYNSNHPAALGMYTRSGWKQFTGYFGEYLTFNESSNDETKWVEAIQIVQSVPW